jgi:hypothetical protein
MSRSWVAVACEEHVARGRAGGFMQVCHGKGSAIRRLRAGARVVYYSPTASFGGKDRLQAFTSIGVVEDEHVYQFDMGQFDLGDGFRPFRRHVKYASANEASILPLLETLELTRGKRNWGYPLRLGLVEITERDFDTIAAAMKTKISRSLVET